VNLLATNSPSHDCNPIRRPASLAKALNINLIELKALVVNADNLYHPGKTEIKKDGSIRQTHDADKPLKSLHRKIKTQLLDRVNFPEYLTGSIKGRDYKTNAELHLGAKIVIAEDISSFFPSTTKEIIFDIWQNFFGFGEKVATSLTALTTLEGKLPQGAITSPQLANLVFWRHEADLQANFQAVGITYSRFVDDIVASSQTTISEDQKTQAIKKIYGMMQLRGYKPKRAKHEITTSGKRMVVTKLTVNSRAGIDKKQRSKIRAAVHKQEVSLLTDSAKDAVLDAPRKVAGKVAMLGRFHPGQAKLLKKRLSIVAQAIPETIKQKMMI
jgi:Reverse transcriptase (RNA-dependent DNA polymerase)